MAGMSLKERRLLENLQQRELIKQRRYAEFKRKNNKIVDDIEAIEYQDWYLWVMGERWEWPDDEVFYWVGDIDRKKESAKKMEIKRLRPPRDVIQKQATPEWRDKEKIKSIYLDRDIANAIHGPNEYHVDHVIPIQGREVCGLHNEFNLRVITASENRSKNNRLLLDYAT